MTPIAIVFFAIAGVVIWGGLAASVIYLVRHSASRVPVTKDDANTAEDAQPDQTPTS